MKNLDNPHLNPSPNPREGKINRDLLSQVEGKLINAVSGGGDAALWNIARGRGPVAETAREVIELATSPYHEISLYQAILTICNPSKAD